MMVSLLIIMQFQHTAARRRLAQSQINEAVANGFNTQPPEGGWQSKFIHIIFRNCFNTQPPEGGWGDSVHY